MAIMYALVAEGEQDRVEGILPPKTRGLLQLTEQDKFRWPYIFDSQVSKRITNQLQIEASIAASDEKGSLAAIVAQVAIIEEGELESAKRNAVITRSKMKMRDQETILKSIEHK